MYFYKNTNNNWVLGDSTTDFAPAGYYRSIVNEELGSISLAPWNDPFKIVMTLDVVNTFRDASKDGYASLANLVTATAEFFLSGSEHGTITEGDMLKATYDPTNASGDAFAFDNMTGNFNVNLVPEPTETYDVGTSTNRFKDINISGDINVGDDISITATNARIECSTNVAIGDDAGLDTQSDYAVAMGYQAGNANQGIAAVAIGSAPATVGQGEYAIAIGTNAGNTNQGVDSIALGTQAGYVDQGTKGIIINSSGSALNDTTEGHIHLNTSKGSLDFTEATGWQVTGGTFRLPNFDTTTRNTLTSIPLGAKIWNTTTNEEQAWNGTGWVCYGRAHVGTGSISTIVISDDEADPSYVTGLVATGANRGVELIDQITGTFENTSGRNITSMVGSISFRPTETGGGVGTLQIVSERSDDEGATWTLNPFSLRTIEIPSSGESFATKVSSISQLLPGTRFRFRMYESGNGGVTITPTSATILGQSIMSPSVTFILTEQETIDIPV